MIWKARKIGAESTADRPECLSLKNHRPVSSSAIHIRDMVSFAMNASRNNPLTRIAPDDNRTVELMELLERSEKSGTG
jgi:hypothetical protein